jgi:hypothetical protein
VIPFANTDEERAAAAGAPFNAQEVIDRAKRHYAEFKDGKEWRQHWRQQRREWRRKWHDGAYWWGHNLQRNVHQFSTGTGYAGQVMTGLMIPLLAIANTLMFCVLIACIVVLSTTGSLFGWAIPGSLPLWAAILLLMVVYGAIASPLRHARKALYYNSSRYHFFWFAAWYEFLSLGVLAFVGWFAYTHVPQVHDFFQHFVENMSTILNSIIDSFRHSIAPKSGTIPPTA